MLALHKETKTDTHRYIAGQHAKLQRLLVIFQQLNATLRIRHVASLFYLLTLFVRFSICFSISVFACVFYTRHFCGVYECTLTVTTTTAELILPCNFRPSI